MSRILTRSLIQQGSNLNQININIIIVDRINGEVITIDYEELMNVINGEDITGGTDLGSNANELIADSINGELIVSDYNLIADEINGEII